MPNPISDRLTAYLTSWYATSTQNKREAGATVQLTFPEFLNLFAERQLQTLEQAIVKNRLRYLQDVKNEYAFVLSWRSYRLREAGLFNRDTAIVCSRMKSRQINRPAKGESLSPRHRASISRGLTGVEKKPGHRENLSASLSGKPKAGWSDERKAARRALLAAKKAGPE